jgi:hypothetical protein
LNDESKEEEINQKVQAKSKQKLDYIHALFAKIQTKEELVQTLINIQNNGIPEFSKESEESTPLSEKDRQVLQDFIDKTVLSETEWIETQIQQIPKGCDATLHQEITNAIQEKSKQRLDFLRNTCITLKTVEEAKKFLTNIAVNGVK